MRVGSTRLLLASPRWQLKSGFKAAIVIGVAYL